MKKTVLLALSLCATIAATAQKATTSNSPFPLENYGINFVTQGSSTTHQENKVNIRQGGNAASNIFQNGSYSNVDLNQARYYGFENTVKIDQFGSFNRVNTLQEGFINLIGVIQNNDLNNVEVSQLGEFNRGSIAQFGSDNVSYVNQFGFENSHEIMQNASIGYVNFAQIGQFNTARIGQEFGFYNTANVIQYSGQPNEGGIGYPGIGSGYFEGGYEAYSYVENFLNQYGGDLFFGNLSGFIGNDFQINQSGEMNSTNLAQIGNGNRLDIVQEGFDNRIVGLDSYNQLNQGRGIQAGSDNYGFLRQTGESNVIQYSQLGMNSTVNFEQNGNQNFARVIVSMNGMYQPQP